ncbi:calcineurin-like phosphoesterase [Nitzschia inconspicua]|uniref:Calcineurin-like phosphoesterase n=1 Tax=Nitzschia inconspicua TaxID=303405 RepID=A0A9K3M5P9_9STRA|nr:calcineurin-like phosphoesterase [Nitzschia inconspicua]
MDRTATLFFWILALVLVQPSKCDASIASTLTNPHLPFGDINVVVLTDVHSWLASHRRQEPYMDADLGDVLSFWERLKYHCESNNMDLFFVNNGDFVHGTGLSQMPGNPSYLIPLLEKMPYDAVNCGNHELYGEANVQYMMRPGGYIDWWGDRYLTSNIAVTSTHNGDKTETLFGNRYKILHGNKSKLLVFGFLYDMPDATTLVKIQQVEDAVQESWFQNVLTVEHYDAILVLAHMDLVDPLIEVIRSAIRKRVGDGIPIVFITGHTHYRGVQQLEDLTMTFEAGKYLDTVGFVSFPRKESVRSTNSSSLFQHMFLDTNKKVLFEETLGYTGASEGETKNGKDLSAFIEVTREKLGLTQEIGCAPESYYVERRLEEQNSLWRLYRDEVIPKVFTTPETEEQGGDILPIAMLLSKGTWRYDIFNNATLIADDIMVVAPFNDTIVYMGSFPASVILQVNLTINSGESKFGTWRTMLPDYVLIGDVIREDPSSTNLYHLYSHDFDAKYIKTVIEKLAPDATVQIKETPFRSTLLWLTFVRENWSCDGALGKFSNLSSPSKRTGGSNPSAMSKRTAAMALSFLVAATVGAITCCLFTAKKIHWCKKVRMEDDELMVLKRDAPESAIEVRSDTSFSDEDQEVL